jgi:P4 family phage/plasmid primase-like protien
MFGLGARYQRAIILHGAPQSGKTQLLNIIGSLCPAEAKCAVPPDDWGDKFLATTLYGKILNICGELSERKLIDGQKFKDIVDGGEMSGQYKNQQIFRFRPEVTHWFASNHMPKTTDTSSGFIRRWLFLTFHYPVSDKDKVTDLGDMIVSEEREAIVAWAAMAMPRLLKTNNFTLPTSHKMLVNEFANVNNSVRYFIKESNKVRWGVEGSSCDENRLYNAYFTFCLGAGGMKPVQPIRFRAMLRELQGELDFTLRISQAAGGGSQATLERLALVV